MKRKIFIIYLLLISTVFLSGCDKIDKMSKEDINKEVNELIDETGGSNFKPIKKSELQNTTVDPNTSIQVAPSTQNPPQEDESAQKDTKTTKTSNKQLSEADLHYAEEYTGAILHTNLGNITVKLYPDAPMTISNFLKLADTGFYDETKFHRVIKGFMIQGGDPNSKDDNWNDDGYGGPAYKFADEINNRKLVAGSLAMANSGPNTNGSQFFIVTAPATPHLDGKHTNFGYVTDGMEVVTEIENIQTNGKDHPVEDVVIKSIDLIPVQVQ